MRFKGTKPGNVNHRIRFTESILFNLTQSNYCDSIIKFNCISIKYKNSGKFQSIKFDSIG